MGSDDGRLDDTLLRRAQDAIDAAAEIVAHSVVITAVSTNIREGTLTSRCAWCGRYRIEERWVMIEPGGLIDAAETTHGICEDCVNALRTSGLSV